ncbi:uncharacterized protein EDB91DRAFT_1345338 [Suillus paluster]|uniref:uncharacterized protein n=1 Tax=Suillus paluster TaxID=48578 RepID=UPI001B861508|nr:uncharacterized protein EDB91DRAFT_1345338 [Suillus paluster]KAG1746552.1 hypothetical protein EDB91DRAFT_1345338 [Suillus paluster]
MPIEMEQHFRPDAQSSPRNPAKQRKGKVRSFLPGFVDRVIFRTRQVSYPDPSLPKVISITNVDSLIKKTHVLDRLRAQLKSERVETQKPRVVNRGLYASLVTTNKEQKAAPPAVNKAQRHSRDQLDLDRKAMQSEMSQIIEAYDYKLRDLNELNIRQGAQVIKLQSRLFDQDEHIAHLESLEICNPVVETVARKTSKQNFEAASPPDTVCQGGSMEVHAIAAHGPRPQATEPAVAFRRNSTAKHELERGRRLVKPQRDVVHDASERPKDDDPFASVPNYAPHCRSRSFGQTLVARWPKTLVALSDAHRKNDEQRPAHARCDHQPDFKVYQDQIATLTSERDTLSRELKHSTRMADSNAVMLCNLELQAQCLLSEHDAHVLEHQQATALLQQRVCELETELEKTTTSALRAQDYCRVEHGNHLEEFIMLFRENAGQGDLIETLKHDFAEQGTMLERLRIQLDLANSAQAIMKRKLRKMEMASQEAPENIKPLHDVPPKAQDNIFRSLKKRLSPSGNPRPQPSRQGSLPATQEIVENESAIAEHPIQSPLAASRLSSPPPPASAHKVYGVASEHARRRLSRPPVNRPITEPSSQDVPNDTLDISTTSIFSDGGVDLLMLPSQDVTFSDNGLASLYSMLLVVRMYAPM